MTRVCLNKNSVEGRVCGLTAATIPAFCQKELNKNREKLRWDSLFPGQNVCLGPREWKAGVLTTRPRCLMFFGIHCEPE
jgi:hypothetical protein